MVRGLKIIGLTLLVAVFATTIGFAQQSKSKTLLGSSLGAKLSQFKKAILRENTSEDEESQRTSQGGARTRNNVPPAKRTASMRAVRAPARTSGQRVQPGDLLPKGTFESGKDTGFRDFVIEEQEDFAPLPSEDSLAGSAGPRSSPATARANELEEALGDLLKSDIGEESPAPSRSAAVSPPTEIIEEENSPESRTARPINLRQALLSKPNRSSTSVAGKLPATESGGTGEAFNDLRRQLEALESTGNSSVQPRTQVGIGTIKQSKELGTGGVTGSGSAIANSSTETGTLDPQNKKMLLSSKQPLIVSNVEGPRSILVGREATYRITLENSGEVSARSLAVEIRIPEWAEIVEASPSSGKVVRNATGETGIFNWSLEELGSRSTQSLTVKLIPRSGQPLNLSVAWTQAPIAAQTMVEVQEPKLEISIGGPEEVLFNQGQRFQLTVKNPGTGVAENVSLQLIPPGGDEQSASSHTLGNMGPGETKLIELELTAREAGELLMKASASAVGGLHCEAAKKVVCLKPELEIDWRGPAEKYAGTEASYYLRLRNPGTAATDAVELQVKIPQGVQLISASEGYSLDNESSTISWRVSSIAPGGAEFLQIRCQVDQAGMNRFDMLAQTEDGELRNTNEIQTNVIAVADLKLTVTDPQGPVPVGEGVVYEIRIRNRGTTDAQNVSVVGLFSEGIDPESVEGAEFSVRDGRVSITPINIFPAGQELALKIRAKASKEGTHVFRAEVTCQDLDIKLAAEETTKFYEDQYHWEDGETAYSNEKDKTINR